MNPNGEGALVSTVEQAGKEVPDCFVIMPISDQPKRDSAHFRRVFDDLFVPACRIVGYRAVRASDTKGTDFIHFDILNRLIDTPMVLCDLSERNANVTFELGIRQAFDLPVALVREKGTPGLFDVDPLRYYDYDVTWDHRQVLKDQEAIAEWVRSTAEHHARGEGINSLIHLLGLMKPASLRALGLAEADAGVQATLSAIGALSAEIRSASARGDLDLRYLPKLFEVRDLAAAMFASGENIAHGVLGPFPGQHPREVAIKAGERLEYFATRLDSLIGSVIADIQRRQWALRDDKSPPGAAAVEPESVPPAPA